MNHTSSPPASGYDVAGEIHPDTVVPPYRAGERHKKIFFIKEVKITCGQILKSIDKQVYILIVLL